ncbi:MAG: tyrosine-protein phosphatase [Bacteroidales bacterium]|nr:tyrosine-protein phosphatase [Bacteroidales bacterium]
MKRYLFFCLLMAVTTLAKAQRYVIHMDQENGKTERLETRRVEALTFDATTDSTSVTLYDGSSTTWSNYDFAHMTFEKLPPFLVHYTQSVETEQVHRFVTEQVYDLDDYEYTDVMNYADHTLPLDNPNPMVIRIEKGHRQGGEYVLVADDATFSNAKRYEMEGDSVRIWNMTPGDSVFYRIVTENKDIVQEGILNVTGQVRMIYVPSVGNFRDMGGWPVDGGGHIRYGKLYRGAKLHDKSQDYVTPEDVERLRDLGILCEFDLRGGTEAGNGLTSNYYSRLGRDVDYRINGHGMYSYYNAVATYPEYFRYGWNMIKAHVFNGDPIYVHCSHGCDRMGTWALVIEGLLGVCENDLNLEYELSAFAANASLWRYRNMHLTVPDYDFRNTIGYIKSLPGDTLRDKFEYFFTKKCGIPQSDVNRLRELMIVK